jgi:hypothetical protein
MALEEARESTTLFLPPDTETSESVFQYQVVKKQKAANICAEAGSSLQKDCSRVLTKKTKKNDNDLCSCGFQSPEGLFSEARRYLCRRSGSV